MKKVDIALLLMAGALAGALVMKLAPRAVETAIRPPAPVPPPVATVQPEPAVQQASDARPPDIEPPAVPETKSRPPIDHPTQAKRPAPRPKLTRRRAPPVTVAAAPRPMRIPPLPVEPQAQRPSDASQSAPTAPAAPPAAPEQPNQTPPARMEPENVTPVSAPSVPLPNQATLNAGMLIPVRLLDSLSSERNHAGDVFAATLDRELVASGFVVAERGARVEGRVTAIDRNARSFSIELTFVHTSDDQDVPIQTERFDKRSEPDRNNSAVRIGGGAVVGAVIGGIVAGGEGAAIGAAAGGGIGAGDVMLTRKPASLPSETRLTFRLRAPVTVTERLR